MNVFLTKNKFYNIFYVGPENKGSYIGTAKYISKEDNGLCEFVLPNGEFAIFSLEDVTSESETEFIPSSKQAFQDVLSENTKLGLELNKKNQEIKQLLKACSALKEKILNPNLDVSKRIQEITLK